MARKASMDSNALTPDVLRELRTPRPYPAVTLTMPTHRRERHKEQDTVRLRNLLTEAGHRLDAETGLDKRVRTAVKEQLGRAVADVDLRHALDGLLLAADAGEYRIWYLPREVPERVVLADTYLTRNLVAATAQSRPYWVLGIAADRATLWSGSGESLYEHHGDGFPMTPPEESWDVEREERVGDTPSTFRDEETRRFLRSVDEAAGAVLARRPRPLHLVGLAPALALLEEAGNATHRAAGRLVKGGLTDGPAPVLLREIGPLVAEHARREKDEVLGKLDEAKGRMDLRGGPRRGLGVGAREAGRAGGARRALPPYGPGLRRPSRAGRRTERRVPRRTRRHRRRTRRSGPGRRRRGGLPAGRHPRGTRPHRRRPALLTARVTP